MKNLAAKCLKISEELTGLKKDGKNAHHKYSFVSHDNVTEHLKAALVAHGVTLFVSCEGHETVGKSILSKLIVRLIDTESGESIDLPWMGEGQDSQDKGLYKSITQGCKTWALKNFQIPSGDKYVDADYGMSQEAKAPASSPDTKAPTQTKSRNPRTDEIKQKLKTLKWASDPGIAGQLAKVLGAPVAATGWPDFSVFTKEQTDAFIKVLDQRIAGK